ncbi:hypothetical protein SLA2020_190930 [Shorea laevis]
MEDGDTCGGETGARRSARVMVREKMVEPRESLRMSGDDGGGGCADGEEISLVRAEKMILMVREETRNVPTVGYERVLFELQDQCRRRRRESLRLRVRRGW